LLAKYRAGKSQYQALKRELEKLSGRHRILCLEVPLPSSLSSHFHSDATSLIFSLESRLANSMSADAVTSQEFNNFWGNFFAFVLLEMIEISQEFKTFESI
jgi:hypothetical protein